MFPQICAKTIGPDKRTKEELPTTLKVDRIRSSSTFSWIQVFGRLVVDTMILGNTRVTLASLEQVVLNIAIEHKPSVILRLR